MTATKRKAFPASKKVYKWLKADRFCRMYTAVNKHGKPCYHSEAEATRWDLVGALFRCYPRMAKRKEVREKIEKYIWTVEGWEGHLGPWSDSKTLPEIIKVLTKLNV